MNTILRIRYVEVKESGKVSGFGLFGTLYVLNPFSDL